MEFGLNCPADLTGGLLTVKLQRKDNTEKRQYMEFGLNFPADLTGGLLTRKLQRKTIYRVWPELSSQPDSMPAYWEAKEKDNI